MRDEHDLEDLLRAVLPLHFDEVRPARRTPSYALCTRTDFRLGSEPGQVPIALACKMVPGPGWEESLQEQWQEDRGYYLRVRDCRCLVGMVYDPEGRLRDAARLEGTCTRTEDDLPGRLVIAT